LKIAPLQIGAFDPRQVIAPMRVAPPHRTGAGLSHKARDGLAPRALVMWLVIMTPAVSASQSPNISQTQSKQCADGNILDAPAAGANTQR
jgi:hypothetical protein